MKSSVDITFSDSECFECGGPVDNWHHVVPRVSGGTRLIPLCIACHEKVHGKKMAHPELIRAGQQQARERGVHVGRPRAEVDAARVRALKTEGRSQREIADALGVSRRVVRRVLGEPTTVNTAAYWKERLASYATG